MSPNVYNGMRLAVVCVALTMCIGCSSTPTPRYYQLHATSDQDIGSHGNAEPAGMIVGVGPVEIPSYVDRDQMVIRSGEAEVERLEFDRWAEPLSQNLTRILIENISQFLSGHRTTVVRWDDGLLLDYRVRIELLQFDFTKTGNVSLVARWILSEKDHQEPLVITTSRFTSTGIPEDYASLVSEMSRHVESLSREIAKALSETL